MVTRDPMPVRDKHEDSSEGRAEAAEVDTPSPAVIALARTQRRFDEINDSINEGRINVWRHVQEDPLQAIGMALGVGYVMGGGIFAPLTGRVFTRAVAMGVTAGVAYYASTFRGAAAAPGGRADSNS